MQSTNQQGADGAIKELVAGFRAFRARYYEQRPQRMQELSVHGQAPAVMVIACSDSRVDPALLFGAEPGEVFMVRNVANLVPPYAPDSTYAGTSSALEFAVRDLGVRHIVVLGHSACGGIQALRRTVDGASLEREFIASWMNIAAEACRCEDGAALPDQQTVEHEGIRISLNNLRSFPWIDEKVRSGDLQIHGWWVDLVAGRLCEIKADGGSVDLVAPPAEAAGVAD